MIPSIYQPPTVLIYPPYNKMIFEEYAMPHVNLPILWTNFYISRNFGNSDMSDLQQFLDSLDRSKKYFTILQYDDGILQDLRDLDILIFSGGGYRDSPEKYYPIPLICMPSPDTNKNKVRDILCSFIGVIQGRHPIREKIKNLYDKVFIIREAIGYDIFIDIMERSVFSLCPRGYGLTSFRICESLQHGSIPIYIYDTPWIPWKDEFDFNDIGILMHEDEIDNIKDVINSKSEEDIAIYKKNGEKIYEEYFTYDGCLNNIIKKINESE
jgi:hypothetical protein